MRALGASWTILLGVLAGCSSEPPDRLALPGEDFYPESITAAPDGALFVASVTTGRVVKLEPGATEATTVVSGDDFAGATGHLVDEASATLYLCAVDVAQLTTTPMSEVRAYDLATGQWKGSYALPSPSICNDLAQDRGGDLYVTDSVGRIFRLRAGEPALALWSDSPRLAAPGGFGADGIAIDARGNVYVNTFSDGRLLRIPIAGDGAPGPVEEIAVAPPLGFPDGMRMLDDDTLIVVNGTGQLVAVDVDAGGATATSTVLRAELVMPTSVAITASGYWVTEGQIGVLLGQVEGPPSLPFVVRRVDGD